MKEELGLEYLPGGEHYRAYVGPPRDYDLISAMVFNLLTSVGLRQHHKLLDIGCGSLRLGRVLIPYLNQHGYVGVEPNEWLVKEGIKREVGSSLIEIKKPQFIFDTTLRASEQDVLVDYIVAQSIFSHCGKDLIENWLEEMYCHSKENAVCLVTFIEGQESFVGKGWIYPGCVEFTESDFIQMCENAGFRYTKLNWYHPRQQWAALVKGDNLHYFEKNDGNVSWNELHTN